MDEILIDEKTRAMLLECDRAVQIANHTVSNICQVIFNINNIDVSKDNWSLSDDRTKLVKIPQPINTTKRIIPEPTVEELKGAKEIKKE